MTEINIVSWNVNGIRSRIFDNKMSGTCKNKIRKCDEDSSLHQLINMSNADFICLQETRCSIENSKCLIIDGYTSYFNESKLDNARGPNRYSGTAIYVKNKFNELINEVNYQIPSNDELTYNDEEGRIIIIYFNNYQNVLINVYTPNSGTNFEKRLRFQNSIYNFLKAESINRNVIYAGDLNVAYLPQDCHFKYIKSSTYKKIKGPVVGILPEELEFMQWLLKLNYKDSFLEVNSSPNISEDQPKDYTGFTWWDPKMKKIFNAETNTNMSIFRASNYGWRIDYIIVTVKIEVLESKVLKTVGEYTEPNASDHAPIYSKLKLN